jgi:hypothetical protein
MDRRFDNRGVAVPLAATLAFGFLILSMAIYQSTVVPAETAETEYEHSTTVRQQFAGLADSLNTAATDGTTEPTTVRLGARYPSRTIFVGPTQSSGVLETVPLGAVTIQNASYAAGDSLDRTYNTSGIRYESAYSRYDVGAETWLEHGISVRRTASGAGVGLSEQRLIDGSQLLVPVLSGSLSESTSGSVTVPNRPVSVDETTVEFESDGSGALTVVAPTRLNESTWKRLLAAERSDGNVTSVSVSGDLGTEIGELQIELAAGTYELAVANVAVGSGVDDLDPAYIFPITDEQAVREGSTIPVSVQVRDTYDNGVSGVSVEFAGAGDDSQTILSDERGVATYEYEASGSGLVSVTVPGSSATLNFEVVS